MSRPIRCFLILLVLSGVPSRCLFAQRFDSAARGVQPHPNEGARLPDVWNREQPIAENVPAPAPGRSEESREGLGTSSIPLSAAGRSRNDRSSKRQGPSPLGSMVTVVSSLAIVLGLFGVLVWFSRRGLSKATAALSSEVVEVLGRTPLTPRQNLHLISVANKLLLVAVSADGSETLTEITEPDEVLRIRALCEQSKKSSVTSSFREVFSHLNSDRTSGRMVEKSPLSVGSNPGRSNA